MRTANVIVVALGLAGLITAALLAWRWRRLPLVAPESPDAGSRARAFVNGLRTLAAMTAAGVVAGALVPGLGGRLVMRILAATSGTVVQGHETDAGETVGRITSNGTQAVIVFVGVAGGVITALAYLAVRRWLPRTAAPAGAVVGVLALGTLGVSDPMSPDHVDFDILEPTWLAVALITILALLFGVTYTAVAARLDARLGTIRLRPANIAAHASLVFMLLPPLIVAAFVYLVGRAALVGRLRPLLTKPAARAAGCVAVGIATAFASLNAVRAIVDIVSA